MSTAPLFLVDAAPEAGPLVLDGPEGRHAATVKRLRVGERVQVADGLGGLGVAEVAVVGRDGVERTVPRGVELPPPAPRVVLAQALVKGDRGELAVELATEAGVDEILPWRGGRGGGEGGGGRRGGTGRWAAGAARRGGRPSSPAGRGCRRSASRSPRPRWPP